MFKVENLIIKNNEEGSKESDKEELFAMVFVAFLMLIVPIGIGIPEEISRQQEIAKWRKLPLSERGGYVTKDGKYIPPTYLRRVKDTRSHLQSLCNPRVVNPDAGF